MKMKRFALPGIIVACVLVLLAAAMWYSSKPNWQPMPGSLTKPPDIDRSRIPLGPYTADFSGLIGGPTGDKRVTFYVVMRPGDVHLQKVGEVGKKLEGASVIGLGIQYLEANVPPQPGHSGGEVVDGLRLLPDTVQSQPKFIVPRTRDSSGEPMKIHCLLFAQGREKIASESTLHGIENGMCTVIFRPAPHLSAWMDGVQPPMFPSMAEFLPELYETVVERIEGEP